ncbi:MAG TPA: aminomethyl-transferring glycine dehydrogenase subunit GcvPA [Chromatiaceae bacterium]|jgi:glycine dehydrogenase subunit 1|nr:aminomethyl-transferring glycine dehydrogenase subunit GcvPA [Chromatiaceae bacterium]HIA07856.1 aminomethyl-transferring glycine dehydrogenase subunit GcvPA [Chromatiaceae bacterium]HIB84452.1 aminomethyl-transferring glycine dehydrogenase subunit GcvPA [Chromatiaceae bacterium]HIN81741.1 aminomethyl-transferring glycine dehydrogenase subunit GcvPA [Chromatiales bacterium]HIO54015.1 aminomethyl-transferring glycine dehydrogenase subunit GcvPA [Chromatiales bacterium]
MPFIPHTDDDVKQMLSIIGASSIDDLFDEIPESLRYEGLEGVPVGASEMEIARLMAERASQDGTPTCFIGAGAYDHHIPAAVWQLTTRGEFYTAYTPYQAEASQGTLQLLYEFQTMTANLHGMDVSNASMYDGGSALAEAVLMAVRANRKSKSKLILVPRNLHPAYRKVVHNIVRNQGIKLIEIDYDRVGGHTPVDALADYAGTDIAALVIPQPNFFGVLEDVDELTEWAHANKALAIGVVNPIAMALLKPAGEWGENGADIVCGEGQPLGIPMSSGGPYYGFLCCKQAIVRQMPGRIIGRTVDMEGKEGFALTLQAREQHIRRSKATSNICTNQGLMVTASTIHMSLLGAEGLRRVALASHANTNSLIEKLSVIDGVEPVFNRPMFHESVLRLPMSADGVLKAMAAHNLLGGFDLAADYPELGECVLVCATEVRTETDLNRYVELLDRVVGMQAPAASSAQT